MKYWEQLKALIKGEEKKLPIPGMDDKTSLLLILIKLAEVDGHVDHFEKMNINMLYNTFGVDTAKVNEYRDKLDDVVLVLPETKREKIDYFWRIITMMNADMYAHPKELKMARELGISLGFSQQKVDNALEYAQKNIGSVISFEEMEVMMM